MPYHDMLVKLYGLKDEPHNIFNTSSTAIEIRKPIGPEKHEVLKWVGDNFSSAWASELDIALSNRPISCFIALKHTSLIGFACYDSTALGFFGPLGVVTSEQGQGVGSKLTRACLIDMHLKGYGYAIIGMAESPEFYKKVAGAVEIPDSSPGIYRSCIGFKAVK